MDNQRLILFVALAFVLLLIWEAWQRDYNRPPPAAETPATDIQADAPAAEQAPGNRGDLPSQTGPAGATATGDVPGSPAAGAQPDGAMPGAERIVVHTDVLRVELDTLGGDVRRVELLKYPVDVDEPDNPFVLLQDRGRDLFVAQSGLRSSEPEPTHHARYRAREREYRLAPGQDEVRVPLVWDNGAGVTVTKEYRFRRGQYTVELEHRVQNGGGGPWHASAYRQLQRSSLHESDSRFIYTYTGGVIYSPEEKYEKIDFDDMQEMPLTRDIRGGWAAMIQHYFLGAWIPPGDELNRYYTKALANDRYVIGMVSPRLTVEPGEAARFHSRLFVGPKLQDRLAEVAPGLELTVDYGVLTILAKPLFIALTYIHKVVGNWGWAIIILTIFIKLVFYKLSETSYRSMANMRKLAPRLKALKERYGDDRQKLNQAMMDLYKREKINPLGGCLPILIQIPVFIALYWVLLESVELRQAPFILWLDDLSTPDPFFVLPLIMGVTMFIQQKLNPAPMDPVQAKIMMALPVVFTVFFAFFPSGLVLYWVANNVLSIIQQWVITRRVEQGTG